jgi:hypothetical protein
MRAVGVKRLKSFRVELWNNVDEKLGLISPFMVLPDDLIKTLLDHFNLLNSTEDIIPLIRGNTYLTPWHELVLSVLHDLRPDFERIKTEDRAKTAAKAKATRQAKKQAPDSVAVAHPDDGDSEGEQSMSDEDSDRDAMNVDAVNTERSGITWKINSTYVSQFILEM